MNMENTCVHVHLKVCRQVHIPFELGRCYPQTLDRMGLIVISLKIKRRVTVIVKSPTAFWEWWHVPVTPAFGDVDA